MRGLKTLDDFITELGPIGGPIEFERVDAERLKRATRRGIPFEPTEAAIQRGDAVRCERCGTIAKRITWTHLKHACAGSITLTEYRTQYPGSPTIAPNLGEVYTNTRETIMGKYGDHVGGAKWTAYTQKQAHTNSFEYKSQMLGMTREQFDDYNASRAVTLANLIAKHGEQRGQLVWDRYCERQRYTTSLEYFVERYGADVGPGRWEEYCQARVDAICRSGPVSKQELQVHAQLTAAGMNFTQQYQIRDGRTYIYDFADASRRLLVEYQGDVWHMNPLIYSADSIQPRTGLVASAVWARDAAKARVAHKCGFRLFTIWESDWKQNSERIIAQLKENHDSNQTLSGPNEPIHLPS